MKTATGFAPDFICIRRASVVCVAAATMAAAAVMLTAARAAEPQAVQQQPAPRASQQAGRERSGGPNPDSQYRLGPDSLPQEGVPKGEIRGPFTLPDSKAYPGTQHTYWVYVPAQYDPAGAPVALMVFQDGQAFKDERGDMRAQNVMDNLIYRREIPVMIGVFINPGRTPEQPEPTPRDWGDRNTNRPTEYNSLDDRYARVITEELMPALYREYNLSRDPEMHGIGGSSSGAIAAFTVAWERPNAFRKVLSNVGSFVNLRGGHVYPEKVLASEKKPIRVFLCDGRNDNRGIGRNGVYDETRDWFYQNVRLMKALTQKGYDVAYTWGINGHGQKFGGVALPEMMRWLWRDGPVSTDPNDTVERSFRQAAPRPTTQTAPAASAAASQAAPTTTTPPPALTEAERRLREDWPYLSRYRDENVKVAPPAAGEDRVVFMGDSITQGWGALSQHFPGKPYINRGISGQTTPQMLVRFRPDVIALKPKVVVLMAGTNDIAGNTGPMTLEMTQDNLSSMVDLAQANGIRVVLASVLPAREFRWKPGVMPAGQIATMNRWIKDYAQRRGLVHLDYYTAMLDEQRQGLRAGLSGDEVHPNAAGYAIMAPLTQAAIDKALRQTSSSSK